MSRYFTVPLFSTRDPVASGFSPLWYRNRIGLGASAVFLLYFVIAAVGGWGL